MTNGTGDAGRGSPTMEAPVERSGAQLEGNPMDADRRAVRLLGTLSLAAALAGCGGGAGPAATSTASTPRSAPATTAPVVSATVPTPPVTIAPTAVPVGATWRAVPTPTGWGISSSAVTAGGPAWTALSPPASGSAPAAWTSTDAVTWQAGPTLPLPHGSTSDNVVAMTSAGTDVLGLGVTGDNGAIVWRSRAGGPWTVIGSGALFDLGPCVEGCASATSIAAGAAGIAIAGYRVKPVGSRYDLETDLWTSRDGTTWARTAAPVPAGSSDRPAAEIAVAALGDRFIAAGATCDSSGTVCRAVVWTSTGGGPWSAPVNLPGGTGAAAHHVAAGPGGVVVLGMRRSGIDWRLAAWTLDEGGRWALSDLDGSYVEGSTRQAVAGDTFVVVTSRDDGTVRVWISTDRRHWAPQAVLPGLDRTQPLGQLIGLVGRPGQLLAIGWVTEPGDKPGGGFWVSP
ncbi:MAG TPA: hypothetical protein VF484_10740 [Candidatus Limnocylindrales bacterium]